MLEKTYQPSDIEQRIYSAWESAHAFKAGRNPDADPFCIVIPPPNVTGTLHMGHALNTTLQDVLCRFERMRGKDVLWQPGMDHAGIATQMVVERQLAEQQKPGRRELGREAFIERVWEWKATSGGAILNQLKRLGASCDWERERFTMDDGLSAAVLKVFVQLYKQGLIYKDKRLVNWDPKLLTAISDLEVQQVETKGHLWHFKYPVKGQKNKFITVATTRPETMLGDSGVAVHPDDERYKDLIGKIVILPLVGREIPIVADDYADPEQGSGAVKITPAHDFNDFEVGRRHDLPLINIMGQRAQISLLRNLEFWRGSEFVNAYENVDDLMNSLWFFHSETNEFVEPQVEDEKLDRLRGLDGLDRLEARERIVEMLDVEGLVDKIEEHSHTVPYGDRSNEVIEPWLTDQWYVNAEKLAKPAIRAVRDGKTKFVPKNWEKTYFDWMENIQPWCISRQLWWGHQIPVWYGPSGARFCEVTEVDALETASAYYNKPVEVLSKSDAQSKIIFESTFPDEHGQSEFRGEKVPLWRDEDVLDTWFSSALWPFSTLGWPEKTPELARYYATDVLVTGFDIIFFWVARMMMMGLHFMEDEAGAPEVPFHTVYIHALVRDAKGQKMSKSKGNIIDPLELIDEYGADALRFTLAAMAAQGRDIKLSTSRIEGYRNFATKLWNAARFCELNECAPQPNPPGEVVQSLNRWILSESERVASEVARAIETHRYNEAADAAYRFVWHVFCDWYLELAKPFLSHDDHDANQETRKVAGFVLDQILKLLHPFMPFVTEELWQKTAANAGITRDDALMLTPWPALSGFADEAADAEIGWVIGLISEIRSVRAEMNVPAAAKIPLEVTGASKQNRKRLKDWDGIIERLARLGEVRVADKLTAGAVQILHDEATLGLPVAEFIDIDAERKRLEKEIAKLAGDIKALEGKLANKKFTENAPTHVVEENRERKARAREDQTRLEAALKRLKGAV